MQLVLHSPFGSRLNRAWGLALRKRFCRKFNFELQAAATVVHDLNADPRLPFGDASFDAAVCCVSVDYLTRPVEVFADVARVLKPSAPFITTFSNRCFPTKAIRGWLEATDEQHCEIVADYFRLAGAWEEPIIERRSPLFQFGDPLFAVWAHRAAGRAPGPEVES